MKKKPVVKPAKVILYPHSSAEVRFGCNEMDDCELVIFNADSPAEAVEKLKAFVEFLRWNELQFQI